MADPINDGGPAFPTIDGPPSEYLKGLSVRDYFAVHADQPGYAEIVTHAGLTYAVNQVWKDAQTSIGSFDMWWRDFPNSERFRLSAEVRYAMADAMLLARQSSKAEPHHPPHRREGNAGREERMNVELKPCPFCGSTAIKDDVYQRDGRMVVCRECHASVGEFNPDANAKAIKKWNRRYHPAAPGEWVKWDGGDFQPVPGEMLVMVMLRDGSIEGPARTREFAGTDSCWKHRGSDGDIIAYRLSALTNTSGDDEAPVAWMDEWGEVSTVKPSINPQPLYVRPQSAAVRDVTDDMISAARKAYSKATGCDDTPHVLDGWIEDALRASLEAALHSTQEG